MNAQVDTFFYLINIFSLKILKCYYLFKLIKFTQANEWQQNLSPSVNDWIDDHATTHTRSVSKYNGIMTITTKPIRPTHVPFVHLNNLQSESAGLIGWIGTDGNSYLAGRPVNTDAARQEVYLSV